MPYHEIGSHRLYYEVHNPEQLSTSPVVLLHGLGSSGEDWFFQQANFSKSFPVLTLDLRGHGRSSMVVGWPSLEDMAGDVAALLQALDFPRAHIVGLSLGGAVALQLGLNFPKLVRSLTVVNGFARFSVDRKGWVRTLGRLLLLIINRMDWLGAWIAGGIFPGPEQKPWRDAAAARIGANSRSNYVRVIKAVMGFDVTGRLEELRAPALIIAGERDTTVALKAKKLLAQRIPDAKLVRFADSGHGTPYDAADRFNQVVLGFLRAVETGESTL